MLLYYRTGKETITSAAGGADDQFKQSNDFLTVMFNIHLSLAQAISVNPDVLNVGQIFISFWLIKCCFNR